MRHPGQGQVPLGPLIKQAYICGVGTMGPTCVRGAGMGGGSAFSGMPFMRYSTALSALLKAARSARNTSSLGKPISHSCTTATAQTLCNRTSDSTARRSAVPQSHQQSLLPVCALKNCNNGQCLINFVTISCQQRQGSPRRCSAPAGCHLRGRLQQEWLVPCKQLKAQPLSH